MKYRIKILSVICFCAIFSVVGCAEKSTDRQYPVTSSKIVQINTEGGGKSEMKNSAEMLRDKLKISEARANGTMEILTQSGVSPQLKKVKLISDKQGIEAIVTDKSGNSYYLAFDGMEFLELVRKDSAQGEIVYGILQ